MSVFAVPRSIARSREKSLYIPLNMERFEPWAAGWARGAGRQQRRASDATRVDVRLCPGSALESKGLIGQPAASGAGWPADGRAHDAIAALRLGAEKPASPPKSG